MKYVYILKSLKDPKQRYIGITSDLKRRLEKHNAGGCLHTAKFKPWRVETYLGFSDEKRAFEFERYLKTGSGKAFSKKRL
jgi:putative endonuclease